MSQNNGLPAAPSRKRKAFSIARKLEIIDEVKKPTRAKVCRLHSLNESRLRGWLRDEGKLRALSTEMDEGGQKRKKTRMAKDMNLENAMYFWFTQQRSEGIPISGPIIQALKFAEELNIEGFKASTGWLKCFKGCHGIMQINVQARGEGCPADNESASDFPAILRK